MLFRLLWNELYGLFAVFLIHNKHLEYSLHLFFWLLLAYCCVSQGASSGVQVRAWGSTRCAAALYVFSASVGECGGTLACCGYKPTLGSRVWVTSRCCCWTVGSEARDGDREVWNTWSVPRVSSVPDTASKASVRLPQCPKLIEQK